MSIYSRIIPFLSLIAFSCDSDPLQVPLEEVKTEVKVLRYDQEIFTVNRKNIDTQLDKLAKIYPFFINGNYKSAEVVNDLLPYLEDSLNIQLKNEVAKDQKGMTEVEKTLSEAFQYFQYYYPKDKLPSVYAYISVLDYEHPVDWIDSMSTVLIASDMYLGPNFELYKSLNLYKYQTYRLQPKFIPIDIFAACAATKYPNLESEGTNFIEKMVSLGKVQYFVNAMLPFVADSTRLKYNPTQMVWAQKKEVGLWRYFVEKKLLHSQDELAFRKFIEDGPFTSSEEPESPGRIGDYIGWRIVKSYMENNHDVSLDDLMKEKDLLKIFTQSKYKPE